jgi:RNA polymerase I specific transcription initiation factor
VQIPRVLTFQERCEAQLALAFSGEPNAASIDWQNRPLFHEKHDAAMESSNDASDVDDDSERSVNSFEASEANRQNRFKGPRSTWRKLTEDERLVFTSMTQMRDQDLSVHLYNAHSMKRRHYDEESGSKLRPWASKVSFSIQLAMLQCHFS